jgi:hypothetical protein
VHRRLLCGRDFLDLQLLLQLVEEPSVGALGEDLSRRRLDHPRFVEAERIEADGQPDLEVRRKIIAYPATAK